MQNWLNQAKKEILENIVGILIILIVLFVSFKYIDIDSAQSLVKQSGVLAPIVFILVKASTIVFAPVSGAPLYPLAGALFGFWKGFLFLTLGDLLGGSIAFYLSRTFGKIFIEKFVKKNIGMIDKAIDMIGSIKGFVITRICFAPLPEIACYAVGLTKIKFWHFFFIHFVIGILPTAILVGSGSLLIYINNPIGIAFMIIAGTIAAILGGYFFYLFSKNPEKFFVKKDN